MASQILKGMGGSKNIKKVWHCATRMRFNVFDKTEVNKSALEKIDGVIQVIFSNDQWQIVIGTQVPDVYKKFVHLDDFKDSTAEKSGDATDENRQRGVLGVINRFISFISSLFTPFLNAICGAGVLKGILALCTTMNWLSQKSGTYILLNAAADSLFYFLPIFIAYNAAKQLNVDRFVSITIAGALLYPQIAALATNHTVIKFFGIPVVPMSYSASVIPIILSIWILSYLEPLLKKIIPESLKYVLISLLELVIIVPLTLIVVGPIGSIISNALANSLMVFYKHAAAITGLVIGGLWQVIVVFGLHWPIMALIMSNIAKLGEDPIFPICCAAVLSQAGAALGVFLKTKNKKMKQISGSACIAAIFGITEPTIYGVTLKYKKPFYIAISSSAVGGVIIGLSGVEAHAFTFPSVLAIPTYLGHGFAGEIIGLLVSFIGAAVLTYMFGLRSAEQDTSSPIKVERYSIPVEGQKIPLAEVNDPVFSSGQMGKGIAIRPNSDELISPISGTVTATFDTNHAIGITDNMGSQVLIHIGIDTVKLQGKYFQPFVKKGDQIKQGQKLIEFDHKSIEQAGYDCTVIMIILNSNDYQIQEDLDDADVNALVLSTK